MRCVAVIMARNASAYISRCFEYLFSQGIEVAFLDHCSDDASYDIAKNYVGDGLCYLERVPFDGVFSLQEQLKIKQQLIESLTCDWVVHADIDEMPEAPGDITMAESLLREDVAGFNVVNFRELVFLPVEQEHCFYESLYYYYFAPWHPRLMRAWKKSANLSALSSGGHVLQGDVKLSPVDHVLRHYIFSSQQHAFDKYTSRVFSDEELEVGWHRNRINIMPERMVFPEKSRLNKLSDADSREYDFSAPWKKHYWEMPE